MSEILHRSNNLTISREAGETRLLVEIRFPTSMVKGYVDAACPRCGRPGKPEQWEIEGPDGRSNTIWLGCTTECNSGRETRWSRSVVFSSDWTDIG